MTFVSLFKTFRSALVWVSLTILFWLAFAIAVIAHGAWLGTGEIDLTDASRAQIVQNVQDGKPALQAGDVIEVYSSFPVIVDGTLDGPGGYATFYVPDGTEVVGAFITDAAGNPLPARPAQAITGSGASKGWGPKGQQTFDVSANGWQPSSSDGCTLAGYAASGEDCNAGLAYIYGDTGIFYSTRPDTALFANGSDIATLENGYLVNPTNGTPWTSVGGSGTARVHNKWDAVQINAFGSGGNIDANGFTTSEETSITGGRGVTPFRSGSPVAGPESGSDWDRYGTTGPWNRIQYDGSCKADDDDPTLPGQEGPANGAGSVFPEAGGADVNSVEVCTEVPTSGFDLNSSDATALPAATNAVRFAFGGISENEVFYGALRLRVTDPAALGPVNAEGHGGDSAQGDSAGNDNPWRYWVAGSSSYAIADGDDIVAGISIVAVNGAPYSGGDIPPGATVRYRVSYANTSLSAMTDAVLSVTLPSQSTATSNFEIIEGQDIIPGAPPAAGSFNFNTIPTLGGLESGSVEFDVSTHAGSGETVQADTQIISNEAGPSLDSISVVVSPSPVEELPVCNGTRFSLVDWETDIPANVGDTVAFSRLGLSGSLTTTSIAPLGSSASVQPVFTLYPGTGGNPMLDAQYVETRVTLTTPLNGVYLYAADLDANESLTVYGELDGQIVSAAATDAPGSFPMTRVANDDGSVTGERNGVLGTGASRAIEFGFSQPIDTLVLRHTPLQFSAAGLSGPDGMHLGDIMACADFTDAPSTLGDALHNFIEQDATYLGAASSGDLGPGNATNADSDDDDGVEIPLLTQGLLTVITATVEGNGGLLQGWIDYNGDGVFDVGTAEEIALNLADDGTVSDDVANDGLIQIDVVVPGDAVLDQTYARFRWSTLATSGPAGFAPDGEVEDFAVTIAAAPIVDRGDAPASYGDPQHIIADAGVAGTYLGSIAPDPEAAPQHSSDATGDDLDGGDDEDGVVLPQLYVGGTTEISVGVNEVTAGLGPVAYLQAWMDFDGDGQFGPEDMIASNVQDGLAGDKDGLTNGTIVFDVNVPSSATSLPTFARFRWSTTAGVVQLALDGEVEDYQLSFSSDAPPVTCDAGLYQIATRDSTLKKLVFTATVTGYTLNLQDLGTAGANLNGGWGYNELDGYIYAVRSGKRELWRVDGSGTFTRMPDPPGSIAKGSNAGDILPNGVMAYRDGNSEFQLLDISDPNNSVDVGTLQLSTAVNAVDFAYNDIDGNFYGIDGNTDRPFKVSANNGAASVGSEAVTFFGPSTFTGSYGAAWFDENGLFYVYNNNTNEIFLVDTVTGVPQLIAVSQDDEGGTNDGASCRGPSAIPFGSISGNIYVDQNGSDTKDGVEINLGGGVKIDIYDDSGTPNDLGDDSFIKSTDTVADGTYQIDGLSPGSTYRLEVDVNDTDLPAGSQIGTSNPIVGVIVAPNGDTPDQNFGFDPQESDLSITKVAYAAGSSTVITQAAPGDVIDWVISVTNSGPGSPSNVKVIEKLPSGFQYLSDDAPDTGDYYDPSTGLWFVDEILPNATEVLTLRVRVLASGNHVNEVEIIESSLPDVDSDPSVGSKTDDFNDGIADDDEDSYEITLFAGERTLSGRLILDNGGDSGTPHDGQLSGSEVGTPDAELVILDAAGNLIASPTIAADGTWSYALAASYNDTVTVQAVPREGFMAVSESKAGLPSLVDPDPRDGIITFTPADATNYANLNIGLIEQPRFTQDQTVAIEPGQVTLLLHEYVATTSGDVSFLYGGNTQLPPGAFSAAVYSDVACDGTPDAPLTSAVAVVAGDRLCVVSRVSASSGAGSGSSFVYALNANTALSTTPIVHVATNTDRVAVGASLGQLTLRKSVRNETQGSPEGTSNAGSVGDVLIYRIQLANDSPAAARDVIIYDRTPAYTSLAEPIATPVSVGSALSCALAAPTSNVIGYQGPLRWECAGTYPPSSIGSVTFKVQIDP